MTFEVGDHVVYPSQGEGVVQERTTREALGETHEYLKVVSVKGDMEVLVPLRRGSDVGLRHTIGADEVDRLFDALVKGNLNLPLQWPPRYRAEQEILARGAAYDLARLIGVLARRDIEKGLAATEREVLDTAKSMLGSELAIVTGTDLAGALARLDAVVAERVSPD
ncbi:MAG: CarD family transcriptional regulator [bacterium]|nr:CarD family transcriptional regulator [bacterium]